MQSFLQATNQPDHQINLAKASLIYAKYEYLQLDIDEYIQALDTITEEIKKRLPETRYPLQVIKTINQYLFEDLGFQGNNKDYYDPRNSYLNEVIERRTGIPITLSVVYLEIAKRLNFPMVGIGMPGHFIIRPEFEDAGFFVDVFNEGEILFKEDCELRLQTIYQKSLTLEPHFLTPVSNQQILGRMLTNLKYIYLNRQEYPKMLRMIELLLLLFPNHPIEIRDRGLLYYQLRQWEKATADLQLYLSILPTAQDRETIRQLLQKMR
ncbi:transglutaminase-like domain-containing protein [Crocosphaera sp. XPORK-15E]|uniref:SirB1 family protein n=1 Tax=Crocosphaera sp. XPORK-15E TaxID=3110247 RepID=UPI002B1F72CC|nr:transglutaminase-like domain-containing protein [Crocosphaera sp. XPORK-15E]MEA5536571.1 transglutaminase-like domain-containing protein [Crocosphaera sp. XPORK-15E]